MADFDIALLRTFASVADSGGFSRAGERVHRTQSTISQQIKKLEEQAGRQLLTRSARAVQLTADGERMLGYARRILTLHDEARNLFAEDLPELVRIGVTEDLAVESLPAVLEPLARAHQHMRLEVACGLSLQVTSDLDAGMLDIGLFRALDANTAQYDQIWEDPLYWVAAESAQPTAQQVLNLVLFPHGCILRGHSLAQLQARGKPWRIAYTSPNITGIIAAVRAGMGVALLSRHMLRGGEGLRVLGRAEGLPKAPSCVIALKTSASAQGAAAQEASSRLKAFMDQAQADMQSKDAVQGGGSRLNGGC